MGEEGIHNEQEFSYKSQIVGSSILGEGLDSLPNPLYMLAVNY